MCERYGRPLLVLDFDGVLHHHDVWYHTLVGPYLRAPDEYKLFQHSDLLTSLLEPYPSVRIILSTSWAQRFGKAKAAKELPPELRMRVIGACRAELRGFQNAPRGMTVWADVKRRKPGNWIALDDSDEGWLPEIRTHFIRTHETEGISDPEVLAELKRKLAEMCK
jgi:hypothetical protein